MTTTPASSSPSNDRIEALRPFIAVVACYLPETREGRKVFGSNEAELFLSDFRRAQALVDAFDRDPHAPQDVAVLNDALRPFGAIAETFLPETKDGKKVTGIDDVSLYLADFRRARDLLLLPVPRTTSAPRP